MGGGASKRRKAAEDAEKAANAAKVEWTEEKARDLSRREEELAEREKELALREAELQRMKNLKGIEDGELGGIKEILPGSLQQGQEGHATGEPSSSSSRASPHGSHRRRSLFAGDPEDSQANTSRALEGSQMRVTRGKNTDNITLEPAVPMDTLSTLGGANVDGAQKRAKALLSQRVLATRQLMPLELRACQISAPESVIQGRSLSLFVCSSIDGENREHAHLNEVVYPRLMSDAARRGVVLRIIDLRDEQFIFPANNISTHEGQIQLLDQMLYEVERCAPWFVALLGEAYSDGFGEDTVWALEQRGNSWMRDETVNRGLGPVADACATDIMVRRGALMGSNKWATILLQRTGGNIAFDPSDVRLESANPVSSAALEAWARSIQSECQGRGALGQMEKMIVDRKLAAIVCDSRPRIIENFYAEVRALLDQVFPSDSPLVTQATEKSGNLAAWHPALGKGFCAESSALYREARACSAYQEMCAASCLTPPERLCNVLTQHCFGGGSAGNGSDHSSAVSSSKALIVIDEMGGGTVSVLLAVWAKQYAAQLTHDKSKNQVVVYHKLGLMDGACSAGREISIVLATIKKCFGISEDMPSEDTAHQSLKDWLHMAGAKGRCIVVLDGLELLEGGLGGVATGLWSWLPKEVPPGCRIIVGVGDDRKTGFQTLKLAAKWGMMKKSQNPEAGVSDATKGTPSAAKQSPIVAIPRPVSVMVGTKLGDLIASPREALTVQEQEQFSYIMLSNLSLTSRAQTLRRLNNALCKQVAAIGNQGKSMSENDWADMAAEKVGVGGLMHFVIVTMVLQRHSNLFHTSEKHVATSSSTGPMDISTCDDWPEETSEALLSRAFSHITKILSKRGLPNDALPRFLLLLAGCYCGSDEFRMSQCLGLSALHFSVLLRELSPYCMSASGIHLLSGPVKAIALKVFSGRAIPQLFNPFHRRPTNSVVMLPLHDEILVAETLSDLQSKEDRHRLRELMTDITFFVSAHHSTYRSRYLSVWSNLAAEEGAADISAELRTSTVRYTLPVTTDGVKVGASALASDLALCHQLTVCRFLSIHASQPSQAIKLLNELRPLISDDGARSSFSLAFWLEFAVAHRENRDSNSAIQVLKDAMSKMPEAGLPTLDPEPAAQHWRDWAYVAGYLADAHVSAMRLMGEMCQAAGILKEAGQMYASLIMALRLAGEKSSRAELELGRALWAAAKISKDAIKTAEAMKQASEALEYLTRQLYPSHPLCRQVEEFVAALDRRQNQQGLAAVGAEIEALIEESTLLKDFGNQDDDNLDDISAGETDEVPAIEREFHMQYDKGHFRMAHKVALKLVLTIEANIDTGERGEKWCSASKLLAKALARRGLYKQSVKQFDQVIRAEVERVKSDSDLELITSRLEQCIILLEQGDYERAFDITRRFDAWDLPATLGNNHPAVTRMRYAQAHMLMAQGAKAEALELLRTVQSHQQKAGLDPGKDEFLVTQRNIIQFMVAMGQFSMALEALKEFSAAVEKHMGSTALEMAHVRYLEGFIMLQFGDYKGCDDSFREASKLASSCVGKPLGEDKKVRIHPLVLMSSWKIAEKSLVQGRYEEARNMYETVLKGFYATEVNINNIITIAEIKEGYATLCERIGRLTQSAELLQEAREMRQLVPSMRPEALVRQSLLTAQQEINLGQYREAQVTVESTIALLDSILFRSPEDEISLCHLQAQLAFLIAVDIPAADSFFQQAISKRKQLIGVSHPAVALLQVEYAYILMEKKDYEGVEMLLKEAKSVLLLAYGKSSAHMSTVYRLQGLVYRDKGEYEKAEYVLQDALLVDGNKDWATPFIAGDYARPPVPRTVQVVEDLESLGRIQYRMGAFEAADHILKHMHGISLSLYGEETQHPVTARALVGMSDMRVEYGQYVDAEMLCKRGLDMQRRILTAKHPHTLRTLGQYSKILELSGDYEGASAILIEIKDGLTAIFGQEHLQVKLIEARLAMVQYCMGIQKRPRVALVACLAMIEARIFKALSAGNLSKTGVKKQHALVKGEGNAGSKGSHASLLERDRAQIFLWLAECDIDSFMLARAGRFIRMAEACFKRMGKTGLPMLGVCKTKHADISFLRGRLAISLSMYKIASANKKRTFWGTDHPALLDDEEGVARVYLARGMYDAAEARFERALELTDNRLSHRNARRGKTLVLIAELMEAVGRYDEADEMLASAKELQIGFTDRSRTSIIMAHRQGSIYVRRGLYAQGKACLEQAATTGQLHTSCRDALRCAIMCEVGFAEIGLRHFKEAHQALRDAKTALERAHAGLPGNSSEAEKKQIMMHALARASRYTKIMRTFIEKIVPHAWKQQRNYGLYSIRARLMLLEGKVCLETGNLEKAEVTLRRLIDSFAAEDSISENRKSPHPGIAECQSYLAQVAYARGQYPESEKLFLSAKDGKWAGGWEGSCTSHAVDADGLGRIARMFARFDEAFNLMRQCKSILQAASQGEETPDIFSIDLFTADMVIERGEYHLMSDRFETSLADEGRKLSLLKQSYLLDVVGQGDRASRDKILGLVAAASTIRSFRELEIIVEKGAKDASMFIISSGAVAVCLTKAGEQLSEDEVADREVSRLYTGDSVGELCLLLGNDMAATLIAVSTSEVLCVNNKAMSLILKSIDGAVDAVAGALVIEDRVWTLEGQMNGRVTRLLPPTVQELVEGIRRFYRMPDFKQAQEKGRGGRRGSLFEGVPVRERRGSVVVVAQQVIDADKDHPSGPSPSELIARIIKLCGSDSIIAAEAFLLSGLTCAIRYSWANAADLLHTSHEIVSKTYYGCWYFSPGRVSALYARALIMLGRRKEAFEVLSCDQIGAEIELGQSHPNMKPLYAAIAAFHLDTGDCLSSLEWANKALVIARKIHGAGSPDAASMSSIVASSESMMGKLSDATKKFERARQQKIRGGWLHSCHSVVDDAEGIANIFIVCGRFEDAELELIRVAAARQEHALKGSEASVAGLTVEGSRIKMLVKQGKIDDAVRRSTRLLDAESKGEGEVMDMLSLVIEAKRALAQHHELCGKSADALEFIDKAHTLCEARFSQGHTTRIATKLQHASMIASMMARDRKGLAEAERSVNAAASDLVLNYGDGHPLACEVNVAKAAIHSACYRYAAAIQCLEAAIKQYRVLYSSVGDIGNIGLRTIVGSPVAHGDLTHNASHEMSFNHNSFDVANCHLKVSKLLTSSGHYSQALEMLVCFYRACDDLFEGDDAGGTSRPSIELQSTNKTSLMTLGDISEIVATTHRSSTERHLGGSPRSLNDSGPLESPRGSNALLSSRSVVSKGQDFVSNMVPKVNLEAIRESHGRLGQLTVTSDQLDMRIHLPGAFGVMTGDVDHDDFDQKLSPFANSVMHLGSPIAMSSQRPNAPATSNSIKGSPVRNGHVSNRSLARGHSSRNIQHIQMLSPPKRNQLRSQPRRSSVILEDLELTKGNLTGYAIDASRSDGGQAAWLWNQILTDAVDWTSLTFAKPRLVEIDALHCQAHLLLGLARYGDAFCTLLALESALSALNLNGHPYTLECEVLKAHCLLGASKYQEAEAVFEYLLPLSLEKRSLDPMSGLLLKGAASVREVMKDYPRAAVLYKQAASHLAEMAGTSDAPQVHECELAVLRVRWHAGLLQDAFTGMQRHIESLERLVGKDHPIVSVALIDYADILLNDREYDTCESLYIKARTALVERCGEDHPSSARTLASLAMLYHLVGPASKHHEVVPKMMDQALATMVERLGHQHTALYPILSNYSTVCSDRGSHDKAQELREWSVQLLISTHGPNSPFVDAEKEKLIASLLAQKKIKDSREMYAQLLESRERVNGADAIELCPLLLLMAKLEIMDGEYQVAEKLLLRSLSLKQRYASLAPESKIRKASDRPAQGSSHGVECVPELLGLAEVCSATEEYKDSEGYYLSCLKVQKQEESDAAAAVRSVHKGHDHQEALARERLTSAKLALATTKRLLASMLMLKGDLKGAEAWGKQALSEIIGILGDDHPRSLAMKASLAGLYRAQDEHVDAQRLYIDVAQR